MFLCEEENVFEEGCVEFYESYFGAKWVRGKRGHGAKEKHIVFGLIKRGGNVFAQVVSNLSVKYFTTSFFSVEVRICYRHK